MRGNVPRFEMIAPKTLAEALARLRAEPGVWRPFAGGTDLMVVLEAGQLEHRLYMSLWGLSGLNRIESTRDQVAIGALATYTDLIADPVIASEFPNLVSAARETGAIAIQNRGTIGGNIANGSPAADTPPSLLVYGASLELISASGARTVPYSEFHTGYKKNILRPDELIHRVLIPRSAGGWRHYYRKVGTRKAQAISKVCFAGVIRSEGARILDARIALGSVAATPVRATATEALIRGREVGAALAAEAQASLSREIAPIDDIRSNREYRLKVAGNLLAEFLLGRVGG
jgi:CO/xanthine dehydrogenase FAD-binding subunit